MRVFSGIQPTGAKHIGNYIGAMRQYVATQEAGDAFFCIVDLHSITVEYDPRDLHDRSLDLAALLFAVGLDPERCTLFLQSHVSAHPDAAWLLSAVTGFGQLGRTPQGTVRVLDSPETIRKKFKTAVTDSGRAVRYAPDAKPGVSNLIEILSVSTGRSIDEVEASYDGQGYGVLKDDVGQAVVELFAPIQERYAELRSDEAELRRLLRLGADKARETS